MDGRFTETYFRPGGDGNLYKEAWPGFAEESTYRDALRTNEDATTEFPQLMHWGVALHGAANENYNRLSGGDHARVDFTRPPYNLTAPLRTWVDSVDSDGATELLALWRLPLTVSTVRRA